MVTTTTIDKLELGAMVVCSAYIKRTGNHFEIDNGKDKYTALLWENGATEGKEVDGFESCEKFETKAALFTGVFVGTTTLCTQLFCDWFEGPYGNMGYRCESTDPQEFAIVYYALNKKRLVPMANIKAVAV